MGELTAYEYQLKQLAWAKGVAFLAAVDHAGVARSTIHRVETGQQRLTWKTAVAIHDAIEALSGGMEDRSDGVGQQDAKASASR